MTAKERRVLVDCIAEGVMQALENMRIVEMQEHPLNGDMLQTKIIAKFKVKEDNQAPRAR